MNLHKYDAQLHTTQRLNHFDKVNAFETNLTADWKKKADEEKGEVEKKEEESDNSGGGRVRECDDFIFIFALLFWIDM